MINLKHIIKSLHNVRVTGGTIDGTPIGQAVPAAGGFTSVKISGDGKITWEEASAADSYLLETRVSGDEYPRFRIRADGRIEWGSGSNSPGLVLSLYNNATLSLASNLRIDSHFLWCEFIMPLYTIFMGMVSGETYARFGISCAGNLNWGGGNSGYDLTMSRRSASILNVSGRLEAVSFGVGNAADGSSLGNVVKKIEIFDNAGNSLGFLPVYDNIS